MGDRANIKLRFSSSQDAMDDGFNCSEEMDFIYLYSHWGGTDGMIAHLRTALGRKERWNDEAYLARIIANEVFHGCYGDELGFGLSPFQTDNDAGNRIIEVDLPNQKVIIGPLVWTFQAFLDAPNETLHTAAREN